MSRCTLHEIASGSYTSRYVGSRRTELGYLRSKTLEPMHENVDQDMSTTAVHSDFPPVHRTIWLNRMVVFTALVTQSPSDVCASGVVFLMLTRL